MCQATANIITAIQVYKIQWLSIDSCKTEKSQDQIMEPPHCQYSETYPETICRTKHRILISDTFKIFEILGNKLRFSKVKYFPILTLEIFYNINKQVYCLLLEITGTGM